jgi:hypothetical protein
MTAQVENVPIQEQKQNDKEYNFRQQQASYEKKLAEERAEREKLTQQVEELRKAQQSHQSDEEDSEPYLDHKRFKKEQAKFGQQIKQETKADISQAVQEAIQYERKKAFLEQNPDFFDVLQKHAEQFSQKAPHLAEAILKMPDNFERQQLVFHNIKTMGLDRPVTKDPSIQDKIDANRRGAFYQPPQMGTPPYAPVGDFSEAGQKQGFQKMRELQGKLRSF